MNRTEHVPTDSFPRYSRKERERESDPLRRPIAKVSNRVKARWKAELIEEMEALEEFNEHHS